MNLHVPINHVLLLAWQFPDQPIFLLNGPELISKQHTFTNDLFAPQHVAHLGVAHIFSTEPDHLT